MARPRRTRLRGGEAGDAGRAGGRRIAGNAALQLAARVLQVASGLITLPLLARAMGTDGFGVYTAALAYVGLWTSFTEFGLANAATIKMAGEPEREARWLGALSSLRTVFSLVLTVLCLAGIPLFLSAGTDLRTVALIFSSLILINGAGAIMAVFMARLRSEVIVALQLLQTTLWLGVVAVLATVGAGPVTVAIAWVSILSFIAVLQVTAARRLASLSWNGTRALWRPLLGLALPIGVAGALGSIYYKIDAVLVFELADAEEAGIYGAAYRFLDPLTYFPAAIVTAFMPVFAATIDSDRARTRDLVQRAGELMVVLGLPAVLVTLVLSPQVVDLLFGDAYARTAEVLPILMVGFLAICLGTLGGYLAPIVGLRWRLAAIAGSCVVLNVAMNVVLIPRHGAVGAAWATAATEVLSMVLLLGSALHALGHRPRLGGLARTSVAGALMLGALLLLEPVGLLPALVGGGLLYAAALLGTGAVAREDLRRLRG